MKKLLAVGVIVLFIGMTISSSTGLYVEKQSIKTMSFGNILYVGGSGTGNYTKIQDAIDDASDGDTVFVYDDSSPYYENVVVDKSINLIGEDRNTTIIDGSKSGNVISITADNILIRGFCIRNSNETLPPNYYAGIDIRSNYNTISGNIITNNHYGIAFYNNANDSKIIDNTILKNSWEAVRFIRNNHNIIISGNTIAFNPNNGIIMWYSRDNNISFNNIMNNIGTGIIMHSSSRNDIFANNIVKNLGSAIALQGSNNNLIYRNKIAYNVNGFDMLNSLHNNVVLNNVERNLIGVYLRGSEDNVFSKNNFIKNPIKAVSDGCTDKWSLNYWNRPRLLPKPIIGMKLFWIIPYDPHIPGSGFAIPLPWLMFDWRPALRPYDIEV